MLLDDLPGGTLEDDTRHAGLWFGRISLSTFLFRAGGDT